MLKAGAMTYGLVVSIVVALLCCAMVSYSGIAERQHDALATQQRLQRNAYSGLELLLATTTAPQQQTIDLFGEGNDSVHLSTFVWGAFTGIRATAVHSAKQHTLIALCGRKPNKTGLYLAERNRPLKLCGQTRIAGECYIPKAGVERAYIEGQTYSGERLVYGKQLPSDKQLPALDPRFIESTTAMLKGQFGANDSVESFAEQLPTLDHSFANKTLVLHADDWLVLQRTDSLSGNIVLHSNKGIVVPKGAALANILCYAPSIVVEQGFVGNCQLIAKDSIRIGKEVQLLYPSAAIVFDQLKTDASPSIFIDENSTLEGLVLARQAMGVVRFPPFIEVNKGAVLTGTVHCQGNLTLRGTVFGSVYTERFVLRTPSSVYENTLLNAVIDRNELSDHYCQSNAFENMNPQHIVQWLN